MNHGRVIHGTSRQNRMRRVPAGPRGNLPAMRLVQALMVLVVVLIIVISLVPLLVLLDLVGGGTGWGLCEEGLSSCTTSYFDGPELLAVLTLAILVLVGALRALVNVRRLIIQRSQDTPLAKSVRRRDGLSNR